MNKNLKWAFIFIVIFVIAFLVYKFAKKKPKFVKGYDKASGEWVAMDVVDYDKNYYSGANSSGTTIFFKKEDVILKDIEGKASKRAIAVRPMSVYYIK